MMSLDEISVDYFIDKLYGGRYLISKLKEKPFFVENNSICAEPTAHPNYWTFNSNPICCEFSSENLERISIFLLHVFNFMIRNKTFNSIHFSALLCGYDKLIVKVNEELNISLEFDNVMSACNIIIIMNEVFGRFSPSIAMDQDPKTYSNVCGKMSLLWNKLHQVNTNDKDKILSVLKGTLVNLDIKLLNAIDLTKHKDFRYKTFILTEAKDLYLYSDEIYNHSLIDSYYRYPTTFIRIDDSNDLVQMKQVSVSYYPDFKKYDDLSNYPYYSSSDGLLSICEEHLLNIKENLEDLKYISHLRRTARNSIQVTAADFYLIVNRFAIIFYCRRDRRNSNNEFVKLEQNELDFLFQYVAELMMTLNEFLVLRMTGIEIIIPEILKMIAKIMNSVRFNEILNVLQDYEAYHAVATLYCLLENIKNHHLLERTPVNLLLILTKIFNTISEENGEQTKIFNNIKEVKVELLPLKFIASAEDIPRIRRPRWKALLGIGTTPQGYLNRNGQHYCNICSELLLVSYPFCLLVCGHAFCCRCIGRVLENIRGDLEYNKFLLCPKCNATSREILRSQYLEVICKGLENI